MAVQVRVWRHDRGYIIRLPSKIARAMNIDVGDVLNLEIKNDKIVLSKSSNEGW